MNYFLRPKKKPVSPLPTVFNNNIVPRAWMGSESINQEAEGGIGYWLRGHIEGDRNDCVCKIQPVGEKYGDKTT